MPTTYLSSKCSVFSQSHVIHLATGDAESVLIGDIFVSNIDIVWFFSNLNKVLVSSFSKISFKFGCEIILLLM